jgi:putative nucleotidyltransferase with HDIG domain
MPLRLYVAAVIAAGLGATLLAAAADGTMQSGGSLTLFVIVFALSAAAKTRPVHLSLKMKMTVDDASNFAGALLLGPFSAMAASAAATLVGLRFGTKMPLYNRLFNTASAALSTGATAVTYVLLAEPNGPILSSPVAVFVAALAGFVVQTSLVDIAVGLQLRRNPLATWWRVHRADIAPHAALYALGAAGAVSATGQPWVLPLVLLPMGLVLFGLREWTKMRQHTKAALIQLADLIDQRDRYTYGHSQRVAALAKELATRMHLAQNQIDLVTEAARLHDIGKITTPDEVLQKPTALTVDECEVMHQHAEAGYRLLQEMPDFWEGAQLVRAHHERPDGKGYPLGATGLELPLEASIISVCDAYDAMTSDRVYRRALPWVNVRAELIAGRGTQWDQRVADAMLTMLEEKRASDGTSEVVSGPSMLPTSGPVLREYLNSATRLEA